MTTIAQALNSATAVTIAIVQSLTGSKIPERSGAIPGRNANH